MTELAQIIMIDADSGAEIDGINFPYTPAIPRAGEHVHWWQDGFPDAAGTYSGLRRDFEVVKVEHDWRYMPRGRPKTVVTVVLHVRELKEASHEG